MKRGLKIHLLEDIIAALAMVNHFLKRTKTTLSLEIGQDTVNVISSLIGCWSTASRRMY